MTEPTRASDDLDMAAGAFWSDTDLEALLDTIEPYRGAEEFAIADLTEEEWDAFVAALDA